MGPVFAYTGYVSMHLQFSGRLNLFHFHSLLLLLTMIYKVKQDDPIIGVTGFTARHLVLHLIESNMISCDNKSKKSDTTTVTRGNNQHCCNCM